MSLPSALLALTFLFLFAVRCSTHGGALLFALVLLASLLVGLTWRFAQRVWHRSLATASVAGRPPLHASR